MLMLCVAINTWYCVQPDMSSNRLAQAWPVATSSMCLVLVMMYVISRSIHTHCRNKVMQDILL